MNNALTVKSVSKTFGAVRALDAVSFDVRRNEVVGLIGENGAGKSTLLKILNGVYQPDSGTIENAHGPMRIRSPLEAEAAGIGMVHQEQSLLLNISVAENLYLGRERQFIRFGKIDWKTMYAESKRHLDLVNLDIDPSTRTELFSFAQRQMVELAKALILEDSLDEQIVILLDEPTSVLEAEEVRTLFDRVRALRNRAAFVFVSHRIDEVIELCDRMYILRDGKVVGDLTRNEATPDKIHALMVGRSLHEDYYGQAKRDDFASEVVLSVNNISRRNEYENVSFDVRKGEILGLCGVIGSGREAVLRSIAGFSPPVSGEIVLNGQRQKFTSPVRAVASGIGYVPQDRRVEGLVLPLPAMENISLPSLGHFKHHGLVSRHLQRQAAEAWVERLSIRPPNVTLPASSFSGGNQQKVVIAKWIQAGVRVLLLDHPTRGVDVGAKQEVYALIRELASEGMAILLTADTLEETLGLCDTIHVMKDHKITATYSMQEDRPAQIDLVRSMV